MRQSMLFGTTAVSELLNHLAAFLMNQSGLPGTKDAPFFAKGDGQVIVLAEEQSDARFSQSFERLSLLDRKYSEPLAAAVHEVCKQGVSEVICVEWLKLNRMRLSAFSTDHMEMQRRLHLGLSYAWNISPNGIEVGTTDAVVACIHQLLGRSALHPVCAEKADVRPARKSRGMVKL